MQEKQMLSATESPKRETRQFNSGLKGFGKNIVN